MFSSSFCVHVLVYIQGVHRIDVSVRCTSYIRECIYMYMYIYVYVYICRYIVYTYITNMHTYYTYTQVHVPACQHMHTGR